MLRKYAKKKLFMVMGTLLGLGLLACSTPTAHQIFPYPATTDTSTLYPQVILALQNAGYNIIHTDKDSLTIFAQRTPGGEALLSALAGGQHIRIKHRLSLPNKKKSLDFQYPLPNRENSEVIVDLKRKCTK